ncbi:MAG: PEGA domain-containing protein [Candidatus Methanoperedens sp.]|nr:PEGA domain-containing protein [Candidatus Methanoperedens sp.]
MTTSSVKKCVHCKSTLPMKRVFVGSWDNNLYTFLPGPSEYFPTPTGTIAIFSSPSGVSIYFDGMYKGTTQKLLTVVSDGDLVEMDNVKLSVEEIEQIEGILKNYLDHTENVVKGLQEEE